MTPPVIDIADDAFATSPAPLQAQTAGSAAARAGFHARFARHGSWLAFLLVLLVFAVSAPGFLSLRNLANIVSQSAVLGVLALGMTIVFMGGGNDVVKGGIDLSIAGNLGLCCAIYAVLLQAGVGDVGAIGLTLLAGVAVGALNAVSITVLGIVPLLATLAVMNICNGVELVLTQNTVVPASSPVLDWLSLAEWAGLPVPGAVLLALAALGILIFQCSPWGLRMHAIGAHPEAARAAGLSVSAYVSVSYLLSGLCVAIGAILSVALFSGSTTGQGEQLLSVVAIATLGLVFSRRLVPTVGGALLSNLFVGMLINGFQLLNISSYWVNGVQGLLILLVVATTSTLRRRVS